MLICGLNTSTGGCFLSRMERTALLPVRYLRSPSHGLVESSPFHVLGSMSGYLEVVLVLRGLGMLEF